MNMRVNQSRHESGLAQVDVRRPGRAGNLGTDLDNAIASDENFTGSDEGAMLYVQQMGCVQHNHRLRGLAHEKRRSE